MSDDVKIHTPKKPPRNWQGGIPGYPQRNWQLVAVEPGSPMPCAWCGQILRFNHILKHPDGFTTTAGLVCSEYLTGDYELPRKREKTLKDALYSKGKRLPKPETPKLPEAPPRMSREAYLETAWLHTETFVWACQRYKAEAFLRDGGLTLKINGLVSQKIYKSHAEAKAATYDYLLSIGEIIA